MGRSHDQVLQRVYYKRTGGIWGVRLTQRSFLPWNRENSKPELLWILLSFRLYSTVLIPTANSSAKVQVSVVQVNIHNCAPTQVHFLEEMFLHPPDAKGVVSVQTPLGFAVMLEPSVVDRHLTLIPIPDGQYDVHRSDILNYCTLQRLGCVLQEEQVATTTHNPLIETGGVDEDFPRFDHSSELEQPLVSTINLEAMTEAVSSSHQTLSTMYDIPNQSSGSLSYVMKVLIALLQNLDFLSTLPDFDGAYNDVIKTAVLHFQENHNTQGFPRLPQTGHLCPNTLGALKKTLSKLMESLHRLGFWFTGDPFSPRPVEQDRLRRFIVSCQESLFVSVRVYGTLGQKTRDEIDSCVKGLATHWGS